MSEPIHTSRRQPDPTEVVRAIQRRSFMTLATTSPINRPHVAGVLYQAVEMSLYASTMRSSRKARNIASNRHVGVIIPVRRLPVGPPSSVQFQGVADILALDDPAVLELVSQGQLKAVTGHGELDLPGGCFLRITPNRRIFTYGLGVSIVKLIRDPLNAGGMVELDR